MAVFGLILNFAGSVILLFATPWVAHNKDLGLIEISETKKKLYIWGVVLLCLGFLFQFVERIAVLFIR